MMSANDSEKQYGEVTLKYYPPGWVIRKTWYASFLQETGIFIKTKNTQLMPVEKRLLVKIFIDGQNFHNRLKDFGLHINQVNYPSFFENIIDQIRKNHSTGQEIVLLKAEWYTTGNNFVDQYPWEKMRKIHLSPLFQDENDPVLQKLIATSTTDPSFGEKYRIVFNREKGKDHAAANKNRREAKKLTQTLVSISKKYSRMGIEIDGKQLDLIYIKYCGFLKIHHEIRKASEKGVDVAIAAQMLSSILDTSNLQDKEDKHDVIPDYNSDILVLISTDMDFIEPLRILYTMEKPVYMVHIQPRLPRNLSTKDICFPIHFDRDQMKNFMIS